MMVEFSIPAQDVATLEQAGNNGIGVSVEVSDATGNVLTGQIVAMDNQIEISTGTLRVKATLPNKDGVLFPGQFATVRVPQIANSAATSRQGVLVPMEAVQLPTPSDTDRRPQVAIVGPEQRITMVRVTLGPSEDDVVIATSGVQVGDTVIVPTRNDKVARGQLVYPTVEAGQRVNVNLTDQVGGHSWPVWQDRH